MKRARADTGSDGTAGLFASTFAPEPPPECRVHGTVTGCAASDVAKWWDDIAVRGAGNSTINSAWHAVGLAMFDIAPSACEYLATYGNKRMARNLHSAAEAFIDLSARLHEDAGSQEGEEGVGDLAASIVAVLPVVDAAWTTLRETEGSGWVDCYCLAQCLISSILLPTVALGGGIHGDAGTECVQRADMALLIGGPEWGEIVRLLADAAEYAEQGHMPASVAEVAAADVAWSVPAAGVAPPAEVDSLLGRGGVTPVVRHAALPVADFQRHHLLLSVPCVVSGLLNDWRAVHEWSDLRFFTRDARLARRLVPLELGRTEVPESRGDLAITLGRFITDYLVPSNLRPVPLRPVPLQLRADDANHPDNADDAVGGDGADGADASVSAVGALLRRRVAYLAQHPLFTQLPHLQQLILPHPPYLSTVMSMQRVESAAAAAAEVAAEDVAATTLSARAGSPSSSSLSSLSDNTGGEEGEDDRGTAAAPPPNVWFGTSGTVTSLHFDQFDNLLCQVGDLALACLYLCP